MIKLKQDSNTDYVLHSLKYSSLNIPGVLAYILTLIFLKAGNSYSHNL